MNGIISNLGGIHVDLKWSSNTSDPVPAQVAFIAIKTKNSIVHTFYGIIYF